MNRKTLTATLAAIMLAGLIYADLSPETITNLVYTRGEAAASVAGLYMTGTSLLLTNCIAKNEAGAAQDLTGIGGYVKVGNSVTSFTYAVTAIVAGSGTWWASCTIPTASQLVPTNIVYSTVLNFMQSPKPSTAVTLELTLTNATGRVYTYTGGKLITTQSALP